jgi:hypothetical protein
MLPISIEDWEAVINNTYEVEFDWIAINHIGQIAVFSSFNKGYIPEKAKTSFELHQMLQSFINSILISTTANLTTKESGNFKLRLKNSKKGLFTFDYQDAHRNIKLNRYDLISQPNMPKTVNQLDGIDKFMSIIPTFNLAFDENISFEQLKTTEY